MKKEKSIKKTSKVSLTGKRAISVFCIIMFCIGSSCIKLALINIEANRSVSGISTSKSLVLGESRGVIYDCNLERLTCAESIDVCAVKPSITALSALRAVLDAEEYVRAVDEISKGNPVLLHPEARIKSDDIINVKIYKRYTNDQLAAHIIGYLGDGGVKGISGIELGFDDVLSSYSGSLRARFFANGAGTVMQGGEAELIDENYNSKGGVVLTIDKNIQSALEDAMDTCGLTKGAAVMLDIKTGAIVAIASRPVFDPNNIADYLDDSELSLFNRALGAYPVGSVFKPLVAASAVEQGFDPSEDFLCTGSVTAGGIDFSCTKSHGEVNMASAIVYSCNCYFVDLIGRIDCLQVIDLAASLGFGQALGLANEVNTYSGNLPSSLELESLAARANLSFGQGSLTATPLQIASLYAMIGGSGEFHTPYLVKGLCDENGVFELTHTSKAPFKLLSENTADMLNVSLELAVREGTGKNAAVDGLAVAGKTATAQSGEYIDGRERLVSWFAGFFPVESPKYALAVMCEDGTSGSENCAPVFALTAKAVSEYEQNNK